MKRFNVLFLCTGNSARSILAEAVTNHLPPAAGKFRAFSAGSQPKGEVNPLALELLAEQQIPTDGLHSKSWNEFAAAADALKMDFVITVCDDAAEQCPTWPGQPMTAQWGVPDPAAVTGTPEETRKAFRRAFLILKRRIELFASLPFDKLSGIALREHLKRIAEESVDAKPHR